MLDEKDIKVLQELLVTKTDLENFRDEYRKDFSNLQTTVDTYAGKADKFFEELVMLSHKVDRHEKWIKQIADKLGLKLEY
ncbi:MAG: hypothetical protein AAB877_03520 [Patescibacteria group bacterium]